MQPHCQNEPNHNLVMRLGKQTGERETLSSLAALRLNSLGSWAPTNHGEKYFPFDDAYSQCAYDYLSIMEIVEIPDASQNMNADGAARLNDFISSMSASPMPLPNAITNLIAFGNESDVLHHSSYNISGQCPGPLSVSEILSVDGISAEDAFCRSSSFLNNDANYRQALRFEDSFPHGRNRKRRYCETQHL